MKIYRDNAVASKSLNGLGMFSYNVTNSSGGSVNLIVETKMAVLLFAWGKAADGTAFIAPTYAASTAYPGTQKVTFAIPAGKTLECFIVGTNGYNDTQTVSTNTTITDDDVY